MPDDPKDETPAAATLLEGGLADTMASVRLTFNELAQNCDEFPNRLRYEIGARRSMGVEDAVKMLNASAEIAKVMVRIKAEHRRARRDAQIPEKK